MERTGTLRACGAAAWVAAAVIVVGPSWGQDAGRPASGADALAGPKVAEAGQKPSATLVERDFNGQVKRLDVPPEEAAVRMLTLDEKSAKRVEAVLAIRAQIIDRFVVENLELLASLNNARQSGDKDAVREALGEAYGKLGDLRARGPLLAELKSALPAGQAAELERVVEEYRAALVEEARGAARARGERTGRGEVMIAEGLRSLGTEIKRSYERQFTVKAEEFDALLAKLSLRPEQETTIRNLVIEHVQSAGRRATAEQRRALFVRIVRELDGPQRMALMREIRERQGW